MSERDRERPVGGTDEGEDEPETIDLGRRSFADTNIANDIYTRAESDRESEMTQDNASIGDEEDEP